MMNKIELNREETKHDMEQILNVSIKLNEEIIKREENNLKMINLVREENNMIN
jgi:hypothetical protein